MNKLREWRVKRLLTQRELAKKSGVSQVSISFAECEHNEPSDLTKQKLSNALEIPVNELFPED